MFISPIPDELPHSFYVYEHRKATTGEVFYVGKGKGNRAWFISNRSQHWKNIAKKHGVLVEIIRFGLHEWYAHELERDLIALHGRLDDGMGKLINKTDGGDGHSGRITSEETRAKFRKIWLGKTRPRDLILKMVAASVAKSKGKKKGPMPEETRIKIRAAKIGVHATESTKAKMSASQTGKKRGPFSDSHRAKISAFQTGRPRTKETKQKISAYQRSTNGKPVICITTGKIFECMRDAISWLNEIEASRNPKHSHIRECCLGKRKSIYGYRWAWVNKNPA